MSKASARVYKIGTIYSRTKALLDKGVMRPENKPIWFDVYEKFPPRVPPEYFRPVDPRLPIDIVYKEDFVRAKFYDVYRNPDTLNLRSKRPSVSQRFLAQFLALEEAHSDLPFAQLFDMAAAKLKEEGVQLKSVAELKKEKDLRETNMREEWKQREKTAMEMVSTLENEVKQTGSTLENEVKANEVKHMKLISPHKARRASIGVKFDSDYVSEVLKDSEELGDESPSKGERDNSESIEGKSGDESVKTGSGDNTGKES